MHPKTASLADGPADRVAVAVSHSTQQMPDERAGELTKPMPQAEMVVAAAVAVIEEVVVVDRLRVYHPDLDRDNGRLRALPKDQLLGLMAPRYLLADE
jgi:hypothetical protein